MNQSKIQPICGILLSLILLTGCSSDGEGEENRNTSDASNDAGIFLDAQPMGADAESSIANLRDTETIKPPIEDATMDEENCGMSPFNASRRPVNILLVIDKSSSMNETPEGFSTDKWSAMKSSLQTALDRAKEDIAFGLELYPMPDGCEMPSGDAMDVSVEAGISSVPKILDLLEETEPGGGTPTAVALRRALDYFQTGDGSKLQGDTYVLLATDGGPNCNDTLTCEADTCTTNLDGDCPESVSNCCDPDQAGPGVGAGCLDDAETLQAIEALADAGIATFVVGIPGSEDYANYLDQFAEASDAENPDAPPSYFAVSGSGNVDGLTSVLTSITTNLIASCKLQLASIPPDLGKLNVEVEGKLIPQVGDDGWELDTDTDPPTIIIKGATCEKIETEGVESITVVYGCPTITII